MISSDLNFQKPTSVIFLGIDGVLLGERMSYRSPICKEIQNKVKELFEKKAGLNGGFSELEWRIAASYSFSETAVANLNSLIERISKVSEVAIVISSIWRKDGTVQDLRERMFATHSFSKLIIDKTPDDNNDEIDLISQKKYGFNLNSKARQIEFWLRENQEKLNIQSFVIFEDYANEISERYPHHFVKVRDLLSESDIQKAYEIMTQFTFSSENFPSEICVKNKIKNEISCINQ